MRQNNQITANKYFNALKAAKNDVDSNVFNAKEWEINFKLSARTMTTLRNLGIIKNLGTRNSPSYEWNNKIPVTLLLAKKVILENNKRQNEYLENRILNIPQKPMVKFNTKQVAKPIQVAKKVSDVGLIRKFLRWIY